MRLLLDENVPIQLLPAVRQVLGDDHQVDHVNDIGWGGKPDLNLIADAAPLYDALVTKDSNQLHDPAESKAIKKAGIHHVRFAQGPGRSGLARAMGSVIAAMPDLVNDLEVANGQRLARIHGLADRKRHDLVDPKTNPPGYWKT